MTDTLNEHADPSLHKGEPLIEMTDVGKTYGAIRALKGINLSVARGERIVVCGPSGSGKSTMIRCINRLEEHQRGQIIVDERVRVDELHGRRERQRAAQPAGPVRVRPDSQPLTERSR